MIQAQPDMKVVAQAVEGSKAIQAYHRSTPDVALLDLKMPGLDGIGERMGYSLGK